MSLIELRQVTFAYPDGTRALEEISMEIQPGERVAVIGQNGAGKTTLVKLINGLLKPSEGTVLVGGVDTRGRTAAQIARQIGYAFQNPGDQIFNRDVSSEIAFGLKAMKLQKEEMDGRVREAARLCGLEDQLDENPYDLSLPARKFVGIASVLAMKPDAVILDEPTAGQDRAGLERLGLILDHLRQTETVAIVITHDMEFCASYFPRCLVMARQRLLADAAAGTVFADPRLIEEAGLRSPYAVDLSGRLGLPSPVLTVNALAELLCGRNQEKE